MTTETPPAIARGALRLALAMRGGVSLSVWIGGAVREIEQLRVDVGGPGPPSALAGAARALGYGSVEVDVLSGASAGGLNAVILAAAMASGASVEGLRDVWMDDADIRRLLRKSTLKAKLSLLDGGYFYDRLKAQLAAITTPAPTPNGAPRVQRMDVLLSVTSVVSNPSEAAPDPSAPVIEQRIDGLVHLRHRQGFTDFRPDNVVNLALAARSTASFPFAFEPMTIETDKLVGNLEFRPSRPRPLLLFDGGVVDNMPVGKASRAIEDAPADGPTERVLLYLHPSPGVPDARAAAREARARASLIRDGARPFDVLATSARSLRSKSLVADLDALEAHNKAVECVLDDRARLLRQLLAAPPPPPADMAGLRAVAELDAERLADLLVSPWEHLDALEPPKEVEPKLTGRTGAYQAALRADLTRRLGEIEIPGSDGLPSLSRHSLRPWSAIIRAASLLIEWCRALEDGGVDVGLVKKALYDIRERALRDACTLNWRTLVAVEATGEAPEVAGDLVEVRRSFAREEAPTVASAWLELGALAVAVRGQAGDEGGPASIVGQAMARIPRGGQPVEACAVLDVIDRALLPLHRGAPTGSLDRIRYLTLSGTADCPWARAFLWPGPVPAPAEALRFQSLRRMPLATSGPSSSELEYDPVRLDPGSKLAGNQLHNFAAFLDRRWRANDWMWGQADAASTLVNLVLDPRRIARTGAGHRQALADEIRRICTAPLAAPRWSQEIVDAGEALWTDAVHEAVRAELAALVETSPVPPVTRALLLWRRQAEIFASEFARAQDSAAGTSPPATMAEAVAAWDTASRRLGDRWGDKATTALGMRATFVGWRSLFARLGSVLRALRIGLAPALAPAMGFVLARRRTAVAVTLFVLGCILPRAPEHRLGRWLIAVGTLVFVAVWLRLTGYDTSTAPDGAAVRRFRWDDGWVVATLALAALVVAGAALIGQSWSGSVVASAAKPAPGDGKWGVGSVWACLVPMAATAAATWVTWFWSKPFWRVVVSGSEGLIVGWWVYLAAHTRQFRDLRGVWRFVAPFGSFWWALIAMAVFSTALGYGRDLADP